MGEVKEVFKNGGHWRMVQLNVNVNVNVNGVVFILLQIWCLYSPNCPMALWKPSQQLLNKMDKELKEY